MLRAAMKQLVSFLLVCTAAACFLFYPKAAIAQGGGVSPATEAWLNYKFANRTGHWDAAYIHSTWFTNWYISNSNTLTALINQGVTNIVPLYGTNFNAAVTGHTAYITFNTNAADLGTTLWVSNTVVILSNTLFNLPTNDWNTGTNTAIWASNGVANINMLTNSLVWVTNAFLGLPTNDWNAATNTAIQAANYSPCGLWYLSEDITSLLSLSNPQAWEAGLWKLNEDGSISPSTNIWYDTLWTRNSEDDIIPR